MSVTTPSPEEIQEAPVLDNQDGSLRGRLALKRAEIRERKPFVLPVPGYEGILAARYRSLDYPALRKIGLKQKDTTSQIDTELNIACDTLLAASVALLEVLPDGELRETGHKWGVSAARDLFGIGPEEVPDAATGRIALKACLPDSVAVMLHYARYDARARGVEDETSAELAGESEAV